MFYAVLKIILWVVIIKMSFCLNAARKVVGLLAEKQETLAV